MISSLYIGASGMKTHAAGMGVLGNNLANTNTVGFKSSLATYADAISQDLSDTNNSVGYSQLGMGSMVHDIKVRFDQGTLETTNTASDLAIEGKGFFGVELNDVIHYTRAGDFRLNVEGYFVDPSGYRLLGTNLNANSADISAIRLEPNEDGQVIMDPSATTLVSVSGNLSATDEVTNSDDPFFAMFNLWDGTSDEPLDAYSYSNYTSVTVYSSDGNTHEITVYYDAVDISNAGGNTYYEFVVGMDPASDGRTDFTGTTKAGLLMAGTLQFNSSGQLETMSAFTYQTEGGDATDLASWTASAFTDDGYPAFNLTTADGTTTIGLDLGLSNDSGEWTVSPDSAADVGNVPTALPYFAGGTRDALAMTGYSGASSALSVQQDGYPEGVLYSYSFGADGILEGDFSNGQSDDLWQVNLFYFTSEYGLKAEGGNHYSATPDSGTAYSGVPGENGLGGVQGMALEQSNVDIATEFVNMIMNQRGFQANGKIITTSDTLLQTALNMKR